MIQIPLTCNIIKQDDNIIEFLCDFPEELIGSKSKPKKHQMSKYNAFMKECLESMKKQEPDEDHKVRFSRCVTKYKESKKKKKEKIE